MDCQTLFENVRTKTTEIRTNQQQRPSRNEDTELMDEMYKLLENSPQLNEPTMDDACDLAFNIISHDWEKKVQTASERGYYWAEIFKVDWNDERMRFYGHTIFDVFSNTNLYERFREAFSPFNVIFAKVQRTRYVLSLVWSENGRLPRQYFFKFRRQERTRVSGHQTENVETPRGRGQ